MSMIHRAFVFDDDRFRAELSPLLGEALRTDDLAQLQAFIEQHRGELSDPSTGEPCDADWKSQIEIADAHQYGELALTKYFDPSDDMGLGAEWQDTGELLEANGLAESILLGSAFESFDPGKQGAYFQSPQVVRAHLDQLDDLVGRKPDLASRIAPLRAVFEAAVRAAKGLYVTF